MLISDFQNKINEEIERFSKELTSAPTELYEPIRSMLSLGGKRIRPLFVLIGCDLFNGKAENSMHAALATELFHNFTLVHDDIMDHAPLRRGKPTLHSKWNNSIAILSGDVMMVKAFQLIGKSSGLWGTRKEYHQLAMKIGKPVFNRMAETAPDYISSDCQLGGHHIEQGIANFAREALGGKTPVNAHPITLVRIAYGL